MKVKVLLFGMACAYALSVAIAQTVPSLPDAQAPASTDLFMVDQRTGATATGWQSRKITGSALLKELPPTIETAANTSELESVSATDAPSIGSIYRVGFSTLGDAPPLMFTWHATWNGTPDNLGYVVAPAGASICSSGCWVASGESSDFNILEFAGNAATDYGAPCTAVVNIGTSGKSVTFPSGLRYPFTTPCEIPATSTQPVNFNLYGATITTSAPIHVFDRSPTDNTTALNDIGQEFFHGGVFNGSGVPGQIAFNIGANYSGVIEDAQINGFDTGIYCRFCLNERIKSVMTVNSRTYGIALDYGNWTGASTNNSQSNASTLQNVRDVAYAGAIASWYISASDGVHLQDVISEGGNPVQSVLWNDQKSTTVKSLTIQNFHSENAPSDAIVTINGTEEEFNISGVFAQYSSPMVDSSNCYACIFTINNTPWNSWGAGIVFKNGTGGNAGMFSVSNFSNIDLTNSEHWAGSFPALIYKGYNSATGRFGIFNLGPSCPAGTINPATETTVGGIVTHC